MKSPLRVLCAGLLRAAPAALLLLAAGCRLDATVDVTLDRDLSGAITVRLVPDAELRGRLDDAGLDLSEVVREVAEESGGWDVTDGGNGVAITSSFTDPEELATRSGELAEGLAAAELRPLEPLTAEVDGRLVTLRGGAGLVPTAAVDELGYTPTEATTALEQAVDYRLRVTAPGEVVETSSGATVEGDTVVWDVPAGDRVDVALTARRPPAVPVVVRLGAVAGALLVLAALLRRRRRS